MKFDINRKKNIINLMNSMRVPTHDTGKFSQNSKKQFLLKLLAIKELKMCIKF